VEQLSRSLAKELGPRGTTVNVVSPGPTDTELFNAGKTEEQRQRLAQASAFGRLVSQPRLPRPSHFWRATRRIGSPARISA
jgi:NAD(P)-dependent dehydrogenase (short-subunit alcohol dehydrogenase family)